jgi:AcrR family transcriptional regulator
VRARILEVAEDQFRRTGYQKTSVADIARELGMSPANVYRFFPSRGAINTSIYERRLNEIAATAFAIARTNESTTKKIDLLLSFVYQQYTSMLISEKYMHELIADATRKNCAVINAHSERVVAILEAIIRQGVETGELDVENATESARAVKFACTPFFHPVLIEQHVRNGQHTDTNLHVIIPFILKALGNLK